ncbi:MAG: DUF2341 domain-containing protein [Candidatus Bathyarchaeota archaeon]|nr:DUF2341 domain-containing protein [Candidatus Bathyarchaeum sp.]
MSIRNKKSNKASWKRLRCKKAISPILATLLLIVIVVAAAIAAYAWVQGSATSQMTQASGFMIIENVRFYDEDTVELTIRNTGTANFDVAAVYINGETHSVTQQVQSKGSSTFEIDYAWELATEYDVKVATTSGLFAEITCATPYQLWYDASWAARKEITIDNTLNPNDLTNYQIMVNVEYDSDMNNDFSDLRFTDNTQQTLIPYWIETYAASDSATVWINVPTVSASSTETIYMYYANPSATSESNPDTTFDLFIDFTADGVISHGGSQDQDSTQWQIIDGTTLNMWGNNWKATMKTLDVTGDGTQAICFDFKNEGTSAEINGIGLDADSSLSETQFYRVDGTQTWGINDYYGYSGAGDWQSYALVLDDFSGSFDRIIFANDDDSAPATDVYYRNVRVAKATTIQPTISTGTEETQ